MGINTENFGSCVLYVYKHKKNLNNMHWKHFKDNSNKYMNKEMYVFQNIACTQ